MSPNQEEKLREEVACNKLDKWEVALEASIIVTQGTKAARESQYGEAARLFQCAADLLRSIR